MKESSWDDVLLAARRLQELLPDAVLVGGTAASVHADHRVSFDDDHILADLQDRFDSVLEVLESDPGWETARVKRPVLILGSLDGVETGIRQLIRSVPLETEEVVTPAGALTVPTLAEMLRVKAWLVLRRNTVRDHLDVVALAHRLGRRQAAAVLSDLDRFYTDQRGPGGSRVATQLVKQLAEPEPYDLSQIELGRYRQLIPRLADWESIARECRALAAEILEATK